MEHAVPLTSEKAAWVASHRWKDIPTEQRRTSTERARVAASVNRVIRSVTDLTPDQITRLRDALAGAA